MFITMFHTERALASSVIMDAPSDEIEQLARDVARAHGARWLSIIFTPEDPAFPWSVSIDEGRGEDATTAHGSTLVEALQIRLTK